eukprot:SAG31_NODE_26648_length_438_cov_10.646018_1_plen_57_part_10
MFKIAAFGGNFKKTILAGYRVNLCTMVAGKNGTPQMTYAILPAARHRSAVYARGGKM